MYPWLSKYTDLKRRVGWIQTDGGTHVSSLSVKYRRFLIPQKVPLCHFLVSTQRWLAHFYHHSPVWLFLEAHINGIIQYPLLCLVSFAPNYAFETYSCICMYQSLLCFYYWIMNIPLHEPATIYHSHVNEHLGCCQCWVIVNKSAVSIYLYMFLGLG